MLRYLVVLSSLFKLWMFVDAVQRGAARYWYPVMFLPFGEYAYFFMVKVHDPEFRVILKVWRGLMTPKVTLEDLRFRAAETPSFANKLALAQGLHDAGEHQEASNYFEEILKSDDECKDALYGYAMCQLHLEQYEQAIRALEHLIDIKPSFQEYAAWPQLAYALCESDKRDSALALLDKLVHKSPRLEHRVLYASYLSRDGQHDKARDQLQLGMQTHKHAPRFQRRQEAAAARKARLMLSQLQQA